MRAAAGWLQVTVPFAYSIMHRSHPVEKSKLEKEFVDEFLGPEEVILYHSVTFYLYIYIRWKISEVKYSSKRSSKKIDQLRPQDIF